MAATVAIVGTCDTKLDELTFLRHEIEAHGNVKTCLIDVGRNERASEQINLSSSTILSTHGPDLDISTLTRGEFIDAMGSSAAKAIHEMYTQGKIDGIVSAGGSGGTALSSRVMRHLPIGLPKLIVSTVASGDTGPIVGESDIALMYSVVDIAGLNQLLRAILSNAGASIAAAALSYAKRRKEHSSVTRTKKRIAITMFGVTTPGVDVIRRTLESRYPVEIYVFHATGHGGKAMERLIAEGEIDAVIDLTTSEVCDHIMGGVMSAGSERLDAAIQAGIPNIVSMGALDMANFGAKNTVPDKYKARKQVEHNPLVTLVRSSPQDCEAIAQFICEKLKKASKPDLIQAWLPLGGVSMLSVPGGPFHDADADATLFKTIKEGLKDAGITIVEDGGSINDEKFAINVATAMARMMGLSE